MSRIGPKMAEVVDYVHAHPGCIKIDAAQHVVPHPEHGRHGGLAFGYRTVNRTIKAGLITAIWAGNKWLLDLAPAGQELARSWK